MEAESSQLRSGDTMYQFSFEIIERAAERIEDDLKPVTTHIEPEIEIEQEDMDMDW
jgi:hypothetical protein